MPEPSELFKNVYVKGYGVEVIFISLVDTHSHTLFYSIITVGLNEAYRFFLLLLVETVLLDGYLMITSTFVTIC